MLKISSLNIEKIPLHKILNDTKDILTEKDALLIEALLTTVVNLHDQANQLFNGLNLYMFQRNAKLIDDTNVNFNEKNKNLQIGISS